MKIVLLVLFSVVVLASASGQQQTALRSYLQNAFDLKCNVCQLAIQEAKDAMTKQGDVAAVLSKVCEKLPIGGELCKAKLVPLASQIAGRLATASATAVCLDIQWCSATDDVLATFQPTNMIAPAVDVPKVVLVKNIECSSCKAVMDSMSRFVKSEDTPAILRSALTQVCGKMPLLIKDACTRMVNAHLDDIVAALSSTDSKAVCAKIFQCPLQSQKRDIKDTDPRVFYYGLEGKPSAHVVSKIGYKNMEFTSDSGECQICQWAVSAVEAYISQQDTEEELARVLQEICTFLPGSYANLCQNFVVVYMDEAVNYIIDNLTPPVVCSKLNICLPPPVPPPSPSSSPSA